MKTIKYLISVLVILSFSIFSFSCIDEEIVKGDSNWCDGKSILLSLTAPANKIVNPMTRSSQSDSTFTDVNLLIYQGEVLTKVIYWGPGSNEINTLQRNYILENYSVELGTGFTGTIYAVANYKSEIVKGASNPADNFDDEKALLSKQFGLDGDAKPKLLMFGEGGSFDVDDKTKNKVEVALKRIYSMITVKVDTKDLNSSISIVPVSVQLKHIPKYGMFGNRKGSDKNYNESGEVLHGNYITKEDESQINGELITDKLENGHIDALALYMYENRQPVGSNGGNQTTKTPKGMEPDTPIKIIETNVTCSYIELKVNRVVDGNVNGMGSGTVTYRFFLGKDELADFDVERNVHYQLTLSLKGDGGVDEGTWRVNTDLNGKINVSDVYVGYRAGSQTKMEITGDVQFIRECSEVQIVEDKNGKAKFTITSVPAQPGEDKVRYFMIKAETTNAHDYAKTKAKVVFTMVNGDKKTAYIYQVPRLVDPVAIYKSADNVKPSVITVREYEPTTKRYETLVSKGKWTATIKYSSDGDWYSIYNIDENGNAIQASRQGLNGTISGEGEVNFVYQPNTENRKSGEYNVDRFGMILVKYHNDWCEHEVYVRQGYRPLLVSGSRFAWSAFNCLGLGKDGVPVDTVATSPTQTGWLFNGGVNIAMHPSYPEYRVSDGDIEYSNKESGKMGKYPTSQTAWERQNGYNPVSSSSIGTQGPCPKGYVVPNAWTYREMVDPKTMEITTGYVYDDDYSGTKYVNQNGSVTYGWRWDPVTGDAIVDHDERYCNPAKGSLFVKKDDKCTNLFFGYGKGVLSQIRQRDPNLVAEIGVGHRYVQGTLSYADHTVWDEIKKTNHAYGAYYWNATNFSRFGSGAGSNHMGKVDFGYNVFSREPNLLDVPGQLASIDGEMAVGIDATYNASFVRCVRDLDIVFITYKFIEVKGSYFFQQFDGTIYPLNFIMVVSSDPNEPSGYLYSPMIYTNAGQIQSNSTKVAEGRQLYIYANSTLYPISEADLVTNNKKLINKDGRLVITEN